MNLFSITIVIALLHSAAGCQFYPPGEYLRFVRVPENLKVGEEVLRVEVHPKRNLSLRPVDKNGDVHYFTYKDLNRTTVALILARSLEELVDTENPQNVLKFRLMCDYDDGEDTISSSLSVTVYVEDVNDHAPNFDKAPYHVTVDELTPVGLTIFRGIRAMDRDKPNTPNSDVQYAITAGNERGKFALDSSHQAYLVLKKSLDYDNGDREFIIKITASDRGVPPKSTSTNVKISVQDNDDLSPKFTKGVYRTRVTENYPISGEKLHHRLKFEPAIFAYDQDLAIDSDIRYDIIAGNERRMFYLDQANGSLFLEKEIDLESEKGLPGNTFVLQIQASQVDNPLKTGVARVEVEVMDLNDNLPEFEADIYNISIVENLPNGFSVLQIVAHDQDQGDNGEFTLHLEDKSRAFSLDSKTGWLSVRDQTILDREKRSSVSMRVVAKEKTTSVISKAEGSAFVNVEVTLLDANDNNPTFIPNNVYDFVVSSEAKFGDTVGQIHAIDPDLGRNGMVQYNIQKSTNSSYPFKIDTRKGIVTVSAKALSEGRHLLFVEASDQPLNPSERRFSLAVVTVEVKNKFKQDLSAPDFLGAPYEFWVGGNVDVGTSVGQIRVVNVNEKSTVMYDLLHSYHEGVPFAVEERSGTITVVEQLSKFDRVLYDFEGVVTDEKDLSLVTNVTIHIVDPKDKNIILKGTAPMEFHVRENRANTFVGRLIPNATTKSIHYFIANQRDVTDRISISSNGSLYTEMPLDRETRDTYRLTIIAEHSRGVISSTGIYQVIIHVDDENDNAPKFDRALYEGHIKENAISGSEVTLNHGIVVKDADVGQNGQFTLSLQGEGSEKFRLDRFGGKIYYNGGHTVLDREEKSVYTLKLVARDKGGLQNDSKLIITVDDENDNSPSFSKLIILPDKGIQVQEYDEGGNRIALFQEDVNSTGVYALSQSYIKSRGKHRNKASPIILIPEDAAVGAPILKLVAVDKDTGDNSVIKYEMVSETFIPNEATKTPFHVTQYFTVNPASGEVVIARSLPPESEFRINLTASDRGGLKDQIKIRILVKDVNDHAPVFKKSWYNFDAEEASYSREILGKIEAIDGDFGQNANISFKLQSQEKLPFKISEFSGVLSVDGELDREARDKYSFVVVAKDNPNSGKSFSSSVNVDVNIIDVNDNAPTFYGYDDVMESKLEKKYTNHQNVIMKVPVYYATVPENSPIGTPVTKVFANDSDFAGNGNGLLLFDIPYKKNRENLFAIDSKEGVVTTIAKLDYEKQKSHNVTIIASDLGSPSLTSTSLLVITVIDVNDDLQTVERPVFAHRYYEVEVEENVPVPLKILTLNVTEPYRMHKLRYSLMAEKGSEVKKIFKIDSRNGTLYIIESPDREVGAYYELKIRLDQYKVGRDMTVMVYPVTNERLGDLGLNEVKVIVRITDVNDNVPKFTISGRPIVAAIPTTANFGYHIVRLQATDPDLGRNAEVRYQILGRGDEETRRFAIDPITGQVRAISNFARDAGKVFGFDVKATDRRGADDGTSAIANVFVYVLDEEKQLVMVMGSRPTDVERNMENITLALYNATGFDVRVRKLEPHFNRNQIDNSATDLYLYAVDPKLNTVVDMEQLQTVILKKQSDIEKQLHGPKVLALASGAIERIRFRSQRVILSTLEVGVIVLGCVVFVGALATAICVICIRRKKKRILQKSFSHGQPIGFPIATLGKPALFPSSFGDARRYTDNVDVHRTVYQRQHESSCPRFTRLPYSKERSRSLGALETSIASIHSSGKDSGIADGVQCQCGQSTTHSSGESSNGYEDSLQSVTRRKLRDSLRYGSSREIQKYYNRRRSLSDDLMLGSAKHHHYHPHHHVKQNRPHLRKSSERLVLACPINP